MDSDLIQFVRAAPAHAPYLADIDGGEQATQFCLRHPIEVAYPAKPRIFLGHMIGEFGQGLAGCDAHAHRNADMLHDGLADLPGIDGVIDVDDGPVETRFIYRVDLSARPDPRPQ